jgi:hypothetical protein
MFLFLPTSPGFPGSVMAILSLMTSAAKPSLVAAECRLSKADAQRAHTAGAAPAFSDDEQPLGEGGTGSSNPAPSSGESGANLIFGRIPSRASKASIRIAPQHAVVVPDIPDALIDV